MEPKQLLKPNQVAQLLNCKPSSVYAWAKAGRMPAYKIGGLVRFDPEEIAEWIKGARIEPLRLPPAGRLGRARPGPIQDVDRIVKKAIESTIETKRGRGYNSLQKGNRTNQPGREVD